MPYHAINKPDDLPEALRIIVDKRIDPPLRDVHSMLRLPMDDPPGLDGGCTFPAVRSLFDLIAGISQELYLDPWERKGRGKRLYKTDQARFEHLLKEHFPWDQEPKSDKAVTGHEAAKCLYLGYRNALTHNLGHIYHSEYVDLGAFRIGKQPMSDEEITRIEQAEQRPPEWTIPTLRVIRYHDGRLGRKLKLKCFLWGVRKMVEDVLQMRMATEAVCNIARGETTITASMSISRTSSFTEVSSGSPVEYE